MHALKLQSDDVYFKFFRDGFALLKNVFNLDEIIQMQSSFDQLEKTASNYTIPTMANNSYYVVEQERIHRIVWCCGERPEIQQFSQNFKILQHVSKILGSKTFDHIICQAHFKIPGDEVAFDWHQDSQHRHYGSPNWQDVNGQGSFVQTLTALDPMNAENGPIRFLTGSHKLGHIGIDQNYTVDAHANKFPIYHLHMDKGDLALFHPYVIHGSLANRSSSKRRVLINGFSYPGANKFEYPGCGLGQPISLK